MTANEPITNGHATGGEEGKTSGPSDIELEESTVQRLKRPLLYRKADVEGKLPNDERDANIFSKAFLFFMWPLLSKIGRAHV